MFSGDVAVVDRLDRPAVIFLHAAALLHPFDAGARKAFLHVDGHRRIGIDTGGVVDRQIRLLGARLQHDLADRHAQIGRGLRDRIDLARGRQRPGRHLRQRDIRIVDVHGRPTFCCACAGDGFGRMVGIAEIAEYAADHEHAETGDHESLRVVEHPAADHDDFLRPNDAEQTADHAEPAEHGDDQPPVADPDIVRQHQRDADGERDHAGEEDERVAAQELFGHHQECRRVEQYGHADRGENGSDQLGEIGRALHRLPPGCVRRMRAPMFYESGRRGDE